MRTIRSSDNRVCQLSEEVFVIVTDEHPSETYRRGAIVRLISDVDKSPEPGYHFSKEYKTVCRIDAKQAEFCGIKKANLVQLDITLLKHL
jgi:hypothetical protein